MTFKVELRKCRYPLHNIDPAHLWPDPSMQVEEGPLVVKLLDNGEYFIEDGRHRAIRALLRGETLHDAIWYDDWQADQEVARLREALKRDAVRQEIALHIDGAQIYPSINDARKAVGMPSYDAIHKEVSESACGREHLHEPHAIGRHMDEFCSGQP